MSREQNLKSDKKNYKTKQRKNTTNNQKHPQQLLGIRFSASACPVMLRDFTIPSAVENSTKHTPCRTVARRGTCCVSHAQSRRRKKRRRKRKNWLDAKSFGQATFVSAGLFFVSSISALDFPVRASRMICTSFTWSADCLLWVKRRD